MLKDELLKMYHELQSDDDFSTKYVNLNYCPVINDEIVTLCVSNEVSVKEINDKSFECFDIILNSTGELIGGISFDFHIPNPDFGNVTYYIKEQFQNNGYATRALKLLVTLLKNNNFKGDKDLYFWIGYHNEYSQKVVLNNGGKVMSGGEKETKSPYMLRIKI